MTLNRATSEWFVKVSSDTEKINEAMNRIKMTGAVVERYEIEWSSEWRRSGR